MMTENDVAMMTVPQNQKKICKNDSKQFGNGSEVVIHPALDLKDMI